MPKKIISQRQWKFIKQYCLEGEEHYLVNEYLRKNINVPKAKVVSRTTHTLLDMQEINTAYEHIHASAQIESHTKHTWMSKYRSATFPKV